MVDAAGGGGGGRRGALPAVEGAAGGVGQRVEDVSGGGREMKGPARAKEREGGGF